MWGRREWLLLIPFGGTKKIRHMKVQRTEKGICSVDHKSFSDEIRNSIPLLFNKDKMQCKDFREKCVRANR